MRVDVQRNLCVFVTGQHLDSLDIDDTKKQIGDIGVAQLMGCYLKAQAVNHMAVITSIFPQLGMEHMYRTKALMPV